MGDLRLRQKLQEFNKLYVDMVETSIPCLRESFFLHFTISSLNLYEIEYYRNILMNMLKIKSY